MFGLRKIVGFEKGKQAYLKGTFLTSLAAEEPFKAMKSAAGTVSAGTESALHPFHSQRGLRSTSNPSGRCLDLFGRSSKRPRLEVTNMKFEVYVDAAGEFRWRLWSNNHQIIATPGEGYKNKQDCLDIIDRIKQGAAYAQVVDNTGRQW